MKNKFNIGDQLWHIYQINNISRVCTMPFWVEAITRDRNELKYGYCTDFQFYEINCFASREEAEAECEQRNQPALRPTLVREQT